MMNRFAPFLRVFAAIVPLCFLTAIGRAQVTISVPADQPTIQAAIDAASNGDIILVQPGTYPEHIDFKGKAIRVAGAATGIPVIDGQGSGPVVTFKSGEGRNSVLTGFAITNGHSLITGAGIEIESASPTLMGNQVVNNSGCGGIGINVSSGSPLILDNTISGNVMQGCSGGHGAGIAISAKGSSSTELAGNTIANNSTDAGGGGITLNAAGAPFIHENIIRDNIAGNGGGIELLNDSNPLLVNNLIFENHAAQGGGIWTLVPSGSPGATLINNTIANNDGATGSALYLDGFDSAMMITNNLLISGAQAAVYCGSFSNSPAPLLSHDDVFSSSGAGFAGACGNQFGTNGNISADPLFVGASAWDFHLQPGSPAIDKGTSAANLPALDFDGNQRVLDGDNDCSAQPDLGAYELTRTISAAFSASSLVFPDTKQGTTSNGLSLTLSSSGQTCFAIQSIHVSADFAQSNSCSASGVPAGTSCQFTVSFTPSIQGPESGTLQVAGTDGELLNVNLSGNGVMPQASLAPISLAFGTQPVGSSSSAQTVTLSNTGSGAMNITAVQVNAPFSESSVCPASLPAGASCLISVTFDPTASGAASGKLSVFDDAPGSPHTVALSGTGTAAVAAVSPGSLTYGSQPVGTTSAPQAITLSNTGNAALTLSGISLSGAFVQSNNCGASVAAGASCTISVSFAPATHGPASGTLTISDSAAGSPQTVALSGTGTAPFVSLSTAGLAFGSQVVGTSTAEGLTLTNTGDAPLNLGAITASGDYTQSNNCAASVAPGTSCAIAVTFTPSAAGQRTASLTVLSNAAGSPNVVALSGVGLDFAVAVSPTSASVANGKNVKVTVTVSSLGGSLPGSVAFACGGLPAQAKCSFSPGSVPAGGQSVLTISTTNFTPVGTYTIAVNGTSGALSRAAALTLVVSKH